MNWNEKNENRLKKQRKMVGQLIKSTVFLLALVLVVLAVALVVDLFRGGKVIRLEAGEELPPATEIIDRADAEYSYDVNAVDVTEVGDHEIYITYGTGKKLSVKVKVRDTEAPKGAVKRLSVHNGASLPTAEDFFDEIGEASSFTAKFADEPKVSGLGNYKVSIILEDEHGNKREYDTTLSVINDTEKPRIEVDGEIIGYIGEGIAYRSAVRVVDNCFGTHLEVDSSDVNTEKEGTYTVTYTATDAAGNKVMAIVPVHIKGIRVTDEVLRPIIADIAEREGMRSTMSKEELCKRIYAYVNDPTASAKAANFTYVGHSNDKERGDWRLEAYLTIQNGQGDCYSYFALSKAFFEYFGIENMDIEREKGHTSDTHFWNLVNIGSNASPRWYYFDATRFAGRFSLGGNNGCLMTKAQLDSYKATSSKYDGVYYIHDTESLPTVKTEIINENYSWN